MAKGNIFLGTGRGKIGDAVLYRMNGEQMSRVRVRSIKNPKTDKQAVQRMILATGAKMASALLPIVNHSFEGIAPGNASLAHFRKLAMDRLRQAAAIALNEGTAVGADFAIKGSPVIGICDQTPVSRGSLAFNGVHSVDDESGVLIPLNSALASVAFTTQEAYEAELAKLGIVPGDQLTFVGIGLNQSIPVATMTYEDNKTNTDYAQVARFCRVVFVPTLPENFSGTLLSGTAINPALIAESEGALPAFSTTTVETANFLVAALAMEAGFDVAAAAVIRSQKQANGKFKYSNSNLIIDEEIIVRDDAYPTYVSYTGVGVEIQVGDVRYLQHAVARPFAVGE